MGGCCRVNKSHRVLWKVSEAGLKVMQIFALIKVRCKCDAAGCVCVYCVRDVRGCISMHVRKSWQTDRFISFFDKLEDECLKWDELVDF